MFNIFNVVQDKLREYYSKTYERFGNLYRLAIILAPSIKDLIQERGALAKELKLKDYYQKILEADLFKYYLPYRSDKAITPKSQVTISYSFNFTLRLSLNDDKEDAQRTTSTINSLADLLRKEISDYRVRRKPYILTTGTNYGTNLYFRIRVP